MNKHKANEVMDIAMKLYNENLAWAMMNPTEAASASTSTLCSNALPETGSTWSALNVTYCNNRNMGMDKPSWATNKDFMVRASLHGDIANSHLIVFGGFGNCDVCEALKSMTEEVSGANYRLLTGSISAELPNGIVVVCRSTGTSGSSCW